MTTSSHSADHEPVSAEPMNGSAAPTPWAWVRGHLWRSTATYWLATVRPSGAPHVMPVLAVWVESRPYVVAPATAFGFGTDEPLAATRWRFQEPDHGAVE